MSSFIVDNHLPADFIASSLRADVLRGLTDTPKWLPPKWFYDEQGSELFEEITRLPEYYPTRAEREILTAHATDIAAISAATTLVELGAGSGEKTRLLLDALREGGTLQTYVPVDVSEAALRGTAAALQADYPDLDVYAVAADFEEHLDRLPDTGRRLVAFLGGTIGNLTPEQRGPFLAALRRTLQPGDTLLLGTDLVKSPSVLVPAYDDSAGVTAAFNRNVLYVINRELKADFEPELFEHVARWDARHEWIEMRLRSVREQVVRIDGLDLDVPFAAGEELRTEISAKFRRPGVEHELAAAGLELMFWWTDTQARFGLSLSNCR